MRETDETLNELQRMSRLLALVAVKGAESKDAVLTLSRAGYAQAEIASLLSMKKSAVGMVMLRQRRGNAGSKTKKAAVNGNND